MTLRHPVPPAFLQPEWIVRVGLIHTCVWHVFIHECATYLCSLVFPQPVWFVRVRILHRHLWWVLILSHIYWLLWLTSINIQLDTCSYSHIILMTCKNYSSMWQDSFTNMTWLIYGGRHLHCLYDLCLWDSFTCVCKTYTYVCVRVIHMCVCVTHMCGTHSHVWDAFTWVCVTHKGETHSHVRVSSTIVCVSNMCVRLIHVCMSHMCVRRIHMCVSHTCVSHAFTCVQRRIRMWQDSFTNTTRLV